MLTKFKVCKPSLTDVRHSLFAEILNKLDIKYQSYTKSTKIGSFEQKYERQHKLKREMNNALNKLIYSYIQYFLMKTGYFKILYTVINILTLIKSYDVHISY